MESGAAKRYFLHSTKFVAKTWVAEPGGCSERTTYVLFQARSRDLFAKPGMEEFLASIEEASKILNDLFLKHVLHWFTLFQPFNTRRRRTRNFYIVH